VWGGVRRSDARFFDADQAADDRSRVLKGIDVWAPFRRSQARRQWLTRA
jgi:hypothetical protein